MVWLSAHKALNHNLGVARKMKWCKGEYIIFFGYLKVRKTKFLIKYMILKKKLIIQKKKVFRFKMFKILPSK